MTLAYHAERALSAASLGASTRDHGGRGITGLVEDTNRQPTNRRRRPVKKKGTRCRTYRPERAWHLSLPRLFRRTPDRVVGRDGKTYAATGTGKVSIERETEVAQVERVLTTSAQLFDQAGAGTLSASDATEMAEKLRTISAQAR